MNRTLHYLILLADLFWIATCLWAIEILHSNSLGQQQTLWPLLRDPALLIAAVAWIALYVTKDLHGFRNGWYAPTIVAQTFVGVFYLVTSLCVLAFFLHLNYSRESLLFLTFLLAGGFVAIRYTVHWMVDSRLDRRPARRVIIMGTGRMVREL